MSISGVLPHLFHIGLAFGLFRLLLSNRFPGPVFLRFGIAFALISISTSFLLSFDGQSWSVVVLAIGAALALCTSPNSSTAQETSRKIGPHATWLFSTSIALPLTITFLHTPSQAYLSSPAEFGIPPEDWVVPNLQLATKFAYLALLGFSFFFIRRLKSFLSLFAFYVCVSSFIYAYVLPLGYPMMSGLSFERALIDQDISRSRLLKDMLVSFILGCASSWTLLSFDVRKIATSTLVVSISLVGISSAQLIGSSWKRFEPKAASADSKPYQFSKDHQNILLIYLDRFMGGFVEKIVEEEPTLLTRLDGFSWYPRTVSAGVNTIVGMPPVLGGYDYLPHILEKRNIRLVDATTEAFRILPINFTKNGYNVNFVNPRGLGWAIAGDCRLLNDISGVNCTHTPPSAIARWAKRLNMDVAHGSLKVDDYLYVLRRLGAMRSLPYFFKERIYDNGMWQPIIQENAGVTFREWAQLKALPELTQLNSEKPQFNVVWSILPHEPDYIGTDCQPKREPVHRTKAELEALGYSSLWHFNHYQAAKCSLSLVADYLDELKRLGVYDNTRIVIVSDHGIINDVVGQSSRAIAGQTTGTFGVATRSVLWVKEENRHGGMTTDETFMPGADVPRLLCKQIGGCINPFLSNKTIDRHGREDPFVVSVTSWQFSRQRKTRFDVLMRRELIGGDPFNKKAWRDISISR